MPAPMKSPSSTNAAGRSNCSPIGPGHAFRWVKQTLKIKHFLGTSENAVRIQIAVALIAFLLLSLAQTAQEVVQSPLAFARLVKANLMHRKRIDRLLEPEKIDQTTTNQMVLKWA